jgi:hypothetical protein
MMNTRRPFPARLSLAAVPLLVLGLAACSPSSGDGPKVKSESEITAAVAKWDSAMDACLASAGFDSEPEEGGTREALEMGSPKMDAMETCTDKVAADLGPRPVTAEEKEMRESWKEQELETAQCLRGKGYDVADPAEDLSTVYPDGISDEDLEACGMGMSTTVER